MARVISGPGREKQIQYGLVVFVGFHSDDTPQRITRLVQKILCLRIFDDEQGKMNLSVGDVAGELLIVPNFTLAAALKKGRRPCFDTALAPEPNAELFQLMLDSFNEQTTLTVKKGYFGAHMDVLVDNNGPVTFIIDNNDI
jgi:D-aminoacyl-tRNA deacylase